MTAATLEPNQTAPTKRKRPRATQPVDTADRNPWTWTAARERAAVLFAENEMDVQSIAASVGVDRVTLHRWRQVDEFSGRVADLQGQIAASSLRQAIGKKHKRIAYLQDLADRQRAAMDARGRRAAADPDAPLEAQTGLFESKTIMSASGKTKTDWKFDAPLVREYRQTLEQAARELGQISDKLEVSGETIVRRYVGVDVDAV